MFKPLKQCFCVTESNSLQFELKKLLSNIPHVLDKRICMLYGNILGCLVAHLK